MARQMNVSTENVDEIPQTNNRDEKKPGRGAAKLREAVDEVLIRDSQQLAEALSKNGQKGKVQSTKFMYELSEAGEATDGDEDAEEIRNMALALARSPQWGGPVPSETDHELDEDIAD
jgi:hypothetical protein